MDSEKLIHTKNFEGLQMDIGEHFCKRSRRSATLCYSACFPLCALSTCSWGFYIVFPSPTVSSQVFKHIS